MSKSALHSLANAPRHTAAQVVSLDDQSEWASHLRRIGFREGAEVEVLSGRDPVMVRCENGCIALRRCMLGCVLVCALQQAQHRAAKSAR